MDVAAGQELCGKPVLGLGVLGAGWDFGLVTGSFGRNTCLEIMMDFGLAMPLALKNKRGMFAPTVPRTNSGTKNYNILSSGGYAAVDQKT